MRVHRVLVPTPLRAGEVTLRGDEAHPFVTVHADRTGRSRAKRQRLERMARGATKQSGRARVPWIEGPMPFAQAVAEALDRACALLAHPTEESATLRPVVDGHHALTVFTGPEGGFHPEEIEAARRAGARVRSLGPRILRAETAPVALAALVLVDA